jgi:hypothetical protein|tara:strand:+ start:390 stop:617 length:228 start_codon:yes stop_codon:yes gene_type:complete
MATIDVTVTIPDPKMDGVEDSIADANGYDAATDGTKGQFALAEAKKVLKSWIDDTYRHYHIKVASDAADTDSETT